MKEIHLTEEPSEGGTHTLELVDEGSMIVAELTKEELMALQEKVELCLE